MATYSIDIPDGEGTRVVTAFCESFGYEPMVPDPNNPGDIMANPITPNEFAIAQIRAYILGVTANFEADQAASQARQAAIEAVQTQIVIS